MYTAGGSASTSHEKRWRMGATKSRRGPDQPYRWASSQYIECLSQRGLPITLVATKWQERDLVWPLSDLDFRLVVREQALDWIAFSEALADAHAEACRRVPFSRRILEHPPGYILSTAQLDRGRLPYWDLATWTVWLDTLGCWPTLRCSSDAQPWSAQDEQWYSCMLADRCHHRRSNDHIDSTLPTSMRRAYWRYCRVSHFWQFNIYAMASLVTRCRLRGKMAALEGVRDLGLDSRAILETRHDGNDDDTALISPYRLLFSELRVRVWSRFRQRLLTAPQMTCLFGPPVASLRARVARLFYYSKRPRDLPAFLLSRESRECGAIAISLERLECDGPRALRTALRQVRACLKSDLSTARGISTALNSYCRNRGYLNDVLNYCSDAVLSSE